MTATVQGRAVSTAFGLVMVASAALQGDDLTLVVAGLSAVAVLVGNVIRAAATLAVLLVGAVLVLGDAPPLVATLCGLSAAGYLVLRHTPDITAPTVIGALGFTTLALAALWVPVQLPWAPLAAPVAVLTLVVLATRPFWAAPRN